MKRVIVLNWLQLYNHIKIGYLLSEITGLTILLLVMLSHV